MSEPILRLSGVHTHIAEYHILQGVDLSVPPTGVTVLLGRNGAGKSTTLRTIMGLWNASRGEIRFAGQDITAFETADICRRGIATFPKTWGFFVG